MRVLLDENVPHDLITQLPGHDVVTVQGLGSWAMSSKPPTSPVRSRRGAGLALTAVLLAPAVALAAPPEYRAAPCHGDYAGIAQTVTCGTLVVDETRGSNNGRRLALPVAVVKALKPRAGAVPVIYLHGGPGGGAVDSLPDALRAARGMELYGQDQDWILLRPARRHALGPLA